MLLLSNDHILLNTFMPSICVSYPWGIRMSMSGKISQNLSLDVHVHVDTMSCQVNDTHIIIMITWNISLFMSKSQTCCWTATWQLLILTQGDPCCCQFGWLVLVLLLLTCNLSVKPNVRMNACTLTSATLLFRLNLAISSSSDAIVVVSIRMREKRRRSRWWSINSYSRTCPLVKLLRKVSCSWKSIVMNATSQ